MISEREKQRTPHRPISAIWLTKVDEYTIGSTRIHVVTQPQARYYGIANTYLVERNGIYFHMTGPELEASTGAFAY